MSTELSLVSRQMRSHSRTEKPMALEHRGESGVFYYEGDQVNIGLLKAVEGVHIEEKPGYVPVHTHSTLTEYTKDGVAVEVVQEPTDSELIEAQMNNDEY